MLAIARDWFDRPSETFVRAHVRTIAPRATVLICKRKDSAASLGCPILTVPVRPETRTDQRRVLEFLRHYKVDVMLAEFAVSGWCLFRVCKKANVELYVHIHGYDAYLHLRKPFWLRRYQELFEHAAGIIAPSRFLANKLAEIGCPPEKLHVSPVGIDPKRFKPGPGDLLRILAVGRLVEKKAPHLTIEAFAGVLKQFPEACLDIIGYGPLMEMCSALIHERGLSAAVRLLGVQSSDQVVHAMRMASMLVQHSVTDKDGSTEGLPVAILEAMASGLPVVATRHSGIPEAVIDGKTGILVDEHDVTGMTQAILSLLANPAQADAMGEAGRERVLAHFTETQMKHRLRAIMGLSRMGLSRLSLRWHLRNALSRMGLSLRWRLRNALNRRRSLPG